MRKLFLGLLFFFFLIPNWRASASPPAAPPLSAAEIISGINSYRAQNGLPSYTSNSTLMAIAQGQSDYQASISSVTHTGPGGTRPRDRAYAAGYGGGGTVWVSEIIYGGYNATPGDAIGWWKTSSIHNSTMLASTYQEIGAGIAYNGEYTYMTAVTGYVVGGTVPNDSGSSGETGANTEEFASGAEALAPTIPPIIIIPVVAAEPNEDGSIVHVVRTGQALWNIAAIYEIPLPELLELNDLPEWAVIFPGDEILVRQAYTPTPTSTSTPVPPTSTSTRIPTKIKTPGGPTSTVAISSIDDFFAQQTPGAVAQRPAQGEEGSSFQNPSVRWVLIIALASIIVVLVVSMFFQQKPAEPPKKDIL